MTAALFFVFSGWASEMDDNARSLWGWDAFPVPTLRNMDIHAHAMPEFTPTPWSTAPGSTVLEITSAGNVALPIRALFVGVVNDPKAVGMFPLRCRADAAIYPSGTLLVCMPDATLYGMLHPEQDVFNTAAADESAHLLRNSLHPMTPDLYPRVPDSRLER